MQFDILALPEGVADPLANLLHFRRTHAAGGQCGSTDTNSTGVHGLAAIKGDHVHVDGDATAIEDLLGLFTTEADTGDIDQHEVIVRAATDQSQTGTHQFFSQRFSVLYNGPTVAAEVLAECLAEADRLARHDMHERSTLQSWEHGAVDGLEVFLLAEYESRTGATQCLVRGGGHEVGDGHGVIVYARRDQAGVVGHVGQEFGSAVAGDLRELAVWNLAGISTGAGHDQLRLVLMGQLRHLIEIDAMRLRVDAVGDEVVELAGNIEVHAVGQVSTLCQIKPEHGIPRLEARDVHGRVGLGTAVRLNVGCLSPEQLASSFDRQSLNCVDMFAAAVVAASWITFGVFVGQNAADRLHNCGRRIVFAGDHLQAVVLASKFSVDSGPDGGILGLNKIHRYID